jgi:hypothetical protein
MVNFDDILFEINDFGKYQKIRYLLICLAGMLILIEIKKKSSKFLFY